MKSIANNDGTKMLQTQDTLPNNPVNDSDENLLAAQDSPLDIANGDESKLIQT